MPKEHDFKKDWEKARKQLDLFSKEAMVLAKKGEQEFIKLSHRSKLHLDSTAIDLKREQLYYLIGKEYVKANAPAQPTAAMVKLLDELEKFCLRSSGIVLLLIGWSSARKQKLSKKPMLAEGK